MSYLGTLPAIEEAQFRGAQQPLLSWIAAQADMGWGEKFQPAHVVVDGGHLVQPLEWLLLDRLNEDGGWTIFGGPPHIAGWTQLLDDVLPGDRRVLRWGMDVRRAPGLW